MLNGRPVVVIDPGHGGTAAVGGSSPNRVVGPEPHRRKEKELTLDLARRVAAGLGNEARVVLTRSSDVNLSLAERAAQARNHSAISFVSLHFNGSRNPEIEGTRGFVARQASVPSVQLAESLVESVSAATGGPDLGVTPRDLGVLLPERHAPQTAACLLETSFLTNPREAERLELDDYRDRLAHAVARAILKQARSMHPPAETPAVTTSDEGVVGSARAGVPAPRLGALGSRTLQGERIPLAQVLERAARIVGSHSFPRRQRERLRCVVDMLRDNSRVDDRYINGFSSLVRSQIERLSPTQFDLIVDRVKDDMTRPIFAGPDRSDDWVRDALAGLDERILQGINFLHAHVATHGAASNPGKVQMKDFIAENQRNRSSIYWCYGEGQNGSSSQAVALQQETVDLRQSIERSLRILGSASLPARQVQRLRCMLTRLRDNPSLDDRYLNGFDFLVKQQRQRLSDEQFAAIVSHVRSDLTRPISFGSDRSDEWVRGALEQLDSRIMEGISYLHEHRVVFGAAADAGKIQMNDFIANMQESQSSIYWCYGEGQD